MIFKTVHIPEIFLIDLSGHCQGKNFRIIEEKVLPSNITALYPSYSIPSSHWLHGLMFSFHSLVLDRSTMKLHFLNLSHCSTMIGREREIDRERGRERERKIERERVRPLCFSFPLLVTILFYLVWTSLSTAKDAIKNTF